MKEPNDSQIERMVVGAVCVSGLAIFAIGYDAGFGQGLRQQKSPTVIFGTQIINNSVNYWSRDAGTVSNSEQPKQESTSDK
ncbi:hypothetical protein [Microcoleus sp. PH2017_05_CCC_O_A]|uniref:hypothetical protein n=1 Tax=Microcoleus sp. PH2017_05_CCC_O_A TaxID=2798816 RepID=UPI001D4A2AE0|nr:hypothetical protein [Microcoleus sp. PH2017_05_CCC_O_A]MCC3437506.1 hypothetical protein [Microcoleus sp. PH2017_05_CCC_O_A]TAG43612.1 MAG: hypothetical protein EAZ33_12260 [Oscillatoriales cyanobacterium]TAG58476.1 MAG: hypothetical protein EAZ28_14630 [Oscillatoriales cyanobacterium]